jgi:hypothetical protein
MDTHVKIVAILYLVFSALGVLGALVILLIFGGAASLVGTTAADEPGARVAIPILGAIGGIVALIILVCSVPGLLAGWGLLQYQEWARILAIILSVLNLLAFPFGTALGVYGLWTLLNQQTVPLFRRGSA